MSNFPARDDLGAAMEFIANQAMRAAVREREAAEKIARLQARNAELEKDAARYRWLNSDAIYWAEIQTQPSGEYIFKGQPGPAMDSMIDAAMRVSE